MDPTPLGTWNVPAEMDSMENGKHIQLYWLVFFVFNKPLQIRIY